MAHYTTNLNLYEKDPATDGADTFNISTMMNDNWDKIDTSTGKLSNLTTQAKSSLVAAINETNEKSGMPIGTIYSVNCSSSYVPDGALPCDGTEYTKAQFTDLWTNYLNTVSPATEPLLKTCTYADYQTAITTYGQCPMFAVDSVNNKFKVPTIKDGAYITQAKSDSELGKSYNESLPNVTGSATNQRSYDGTSSTNGTGAILETRTANAQTFWDGTDNASLYTLSIDASRSSSTYQNNAKVQGDNVRLRYFVQVANGQINQSQMDWSAWASSLAGKVNISSLVDCRVVTQVSSKSILPRWYRIYSDGWCEQGGYGISTNSHIDTISLIKNYSDTNYNITMTPAHSSWLESAPTVGNVNKTVNSFIVNTVFVYNFYWETSGYLAEGQY